MDHTVDDMRMKVAPDRVQWNVLASALLNLRRLLTQCQLVNKSKCW